MSAASPRDAAIVFSRRPLLGFRQTKKTEGNVRKFLISAAVGALAMGSAAAQDLKIALIYGKTGPLEAYAKQTEAGLRLGFEYATKGTMTLDGRKIVLIVKDDQTKPDVAKTALAEAY